jgi:hypothetical protein
VEIVGINISFVTVNDPRDKHLLSCEIAPLTSWNSRSCAPSSLLRFACYRIKSVRGSGMRSVSEHGFSSPQRSAHPADRLRSSFEPPTLQASAGSVVTPDHGQPGGSSHAVRVPRRTVRGDGRRGLVMIILMSYHLDPAEFRRPGHWE